MGQVRTCIPIQDMQAAAIGIGPRFAVSRPRKKHRAEMN
jgi:hypothetical protein